MAETFATILIPDISGYTEFMTTTELSHGSHAINVLIDAMVKAVGEEYEVSEIEGDAVLLIKKGPPPSKKEIQDICIKIFNAFHFQRKWMQLHTVCPCGACQGIINLSLKFIAHHGPVAEITVGRFVKQSGPEMIVAHRLLKNSINNHEYLLITDKLLKQVPDFATPVEREWTSSSEEYASVGRIDYYFMLLNEARKKVPEPPEPEDYPLTDDTTYLQIPIAADYMDVYMTVMNIPGRVGWMPGLLKVEQDMSQVFIGSIHRCSFEHFQATLSPIRFSNSDEGIMYAERWEIGQMNISLILEYVLKKAGERSSDFAWRLINPGETPVPTEINGFLFQEMKKMSEGLKSHCESVRDRAQF